MKKDSIKNFAKKVLTVGFCVPVAFVCSAVPAMAADTAGTGGTASDTSVVEPQSTSTTGEAQTKESSKVVTPQAVPEKQPSVTETKTDNNNGTPEKTVKAASEEANDSTGTKETEQNAITAKDFLGDAVNYGITAERFTLTSGDAETNVAAKTAECANQTGNDKTFEKDKQEFIIGQVPEGKEFKIKGNSNTTVYCPETVNNFVKALGSVKITTVKTNSDRVNLAIDGLKKIVKVHSDACLQNAAQSDSLRATVSYDSGDKKYHLKLPKGQQGTYYVTLDSSIFSNNPDEQNTVAKFRQDGSLLITAYEGQSIVFNVTDDFINKEDRSSSDLSEGMLELTQFMWNGNGSGNYTDGNDDTVAKSVIWNLANTNLQHVNIVGSMAGVVYAPNAEVKVKSTSAGWIVANTVTIDSGEWHNVSYYGFTPTTPEKIIEDAPKKDDQSGDTVKPGTGEGGNPSDSGKTDTPSVENPSGHNENGNTGGSSTEIKNTDKPSETGKNKPEEEKPTEDTKSPSTPSIDTPTVPTTPVVTPITPTPTFPSENTGEKNNSQNTNPKTDDNQTTPGTNTGDQKGSTTQTKHNDAQDNHSAAGTDTAAGQTTGTQTVKAHAQNAKSTAPAVQTSTSTASASAAKSTIPRTADETRLGAELMLFGGAAAALAAALVLKRKENE